MNAQEFTNKIAGFPTTAEIMADADTDDKKQLLYEESVSESWQDLDKLILEARKIVGGRKDGVWIVAIADDCSHPATMLGPFDTKEEAEAHIMDPANDSWYEDALITAGNESREKYPSPDVYTWFVNDPSELGSRP